MKDVLGLSYPNMQEQAYSTIVAHSIAASDLLNAAIAGTASTVWTTPFPNTYLGQQLRMVARVIAARTALSMQRQIFFCTVGGYDTHANQTNVDVTTGAHADLMNELSTAMFAFQRAIEQIGTTFAGEDTHVPRERQRQRSRLGQPSPDRRRRRARPENLRHLPGPDRQRSRRHGHRPLDPEDLGGPIFCDASQMVRRLDLGYPHGLPEPEPLRDE
jgi:hypothetical protein